LTKSYDVTAAWLTALNFWKLEFVGLDFKL